MTGLLSCWDALSWLLVWFLVVLPRDDSSLRFPVVGFTSLYMLLYMHVSRFPNPSQHERVPCMQKDVGM